MIVAQILWIVECVCLPLGSANAASAPAHSYHHTFRSFFMYWFSQTKSGWIWDFGETEKVSEFKCVKWGSMRRESRVMGIAKIPREICKIGLNSYFTISILFAQVVDSKNPNKSNGFCLIPARKSTIPKSISKAFDERVYIYPWAGYIQYNIHSYSLHVSGIQYTYTHTSITNRTFLFQLLPKIQLYFCISISIEMWWKWLKTVAGYCIWQYCV